MIGHTSASSSPVSLVQRMLTFKFNIKIILQHYLLKSYLIESKIKEIPDTYNAKFIITVSHIYSMNIDIYWSIKQENLDIANVETTV